MTAPTLTQFLLNMMRADRATLSRANTDKLAARYQIPAAWVRFYINEWLPFATPQETTR